MTVKYLYHANKGLAKSVIVLQDGKDTVKTIYDPLLELNRILHDNESMKRELEKKTSCKKKETARLTKEVQVLKNGMDEAIRALDEAILDKEELDLHVKELESKLKLLKPKTIEDDIALMYLWLRATLFLGIEYVRKLFPRRP